MKIDFVAQSSLTFDLCDITNPSRSLYPKIVKMLESCKKVARFYCGDDNSFSITLADKLNTCISVHDNRLRVRQGVDWSYPNFEFYSEVDKVDMVYICLRKTEFTPMLLSVTPTDRYSGAICIHLNF